MQPFTVAVLVMVFGVFTGSAVSKIRGREAYGIYRAGLRATGLVPGRLLAAVAAGLAVAEVALAVAAVPAALVVAAGGSAAGILAVAVLAAATAVMAVLTVGVTAAWRRGSRAPCACFGAGHPLGPVHVVRNGCLLTLLVAALMVSAASVATGSGGWGLDAVAATAGGVAAMLFVRADDLADLFAATPAPTRPDRTPTPIRQGRR